MSQPVIVPLRFAAWEGDRRNALALLMSPETGRSTIHSAIAAGDLQRIDL